MKGHDAIAPRFPLDFRKENAIACSTTFIQVRQNPLSRWSRAGQQRARRRGSGGLGDRMQPAGSDAQARPTSTAHVPADRTTEATHGPSQSPYGICTPQRLFGAPERRKRRPRTSLLANLACVAVLVCVCSLGLTATSAFGARQTLLAAVFGAEGQAAARPHGINATFASDQDGAASYSTLMTPDLA